jgi:hypothetical protein
VERPSINGFNPEASRVAVVSKLMSRFVGGLLRKFA